LTDKGNEVIARDPFEVLVRAVGSLDAEEQTAMRDALHHVLTTVAASGAHRHFGVCQDSAYLGRETCRSSTSATGSAAYMPRTARLFWPKWPFSSGGAAGSGARVMKRDSGEGSVDCCRHPWQ